MTTTPPNGTHEAHIPDKARYLTMKETKKLLVADIRASFPGVNFRVTTRNNNFIVEWSNGPAWRKVRKVTQTFTSKGTIDNSDYVPAVDTWHNGELVYFGNDYVELLHNFTHSAIETVANVYRSWANCEPFEIIDESRGSSIYWRHPHRDAFYEILRNLDEEQYDLFTIKMHKGRGIINQPLCVHCDDSYVDDIATGLCETCTGILAHRNHCRTLIHAPLPESATPAERLNLIREKYYACLQVIQTFGDNAELHELYHECYIQKSYDFEAQANALIAEIEQAEEEQKIIDFQARRYRLQQRQQ